jgi:hypothetical protein
LKAVKTLKSKDTEKASGRVKALFVLHSAINHWC